MSSREIMRREWTRMPSPAAGGKGAVISNLLALAFVAGLLPFEMGKAFLEPFSLMAFAALSVFVVASLITRCFAERRPGGICGNSPPAARRAPQWHLAKRQRPPCAVGCLA